MPTAQTSVTSTSHSRLLGLDGLRAIAVTLVFLTHKTYIGNTLGLGGTGVHLFYVLSGFLIIAILVGQRRKVEGSLSTVWREWWDFFLKRGFRIFPVAYAFNTFLCVAFPVTMLYALQLFAYVSNLRIAYITGVYPDVGGHLWSLAVEEQFYFVAAPLFLLTPSRYARLVCCALIALAIASSAALLLAHFSERALYVGSPSNFGLMALGGLVALTPGLRRLNAAMTTLALTTFLASPLIGWALLQRLHIQHSSTAVLWLAPLAIALAIGGIAGAQGDILARSLDLWPLRAFGRVSYGFYLFHPYVALESFYPHLSKFVYIPVDFFAAVGLASLSWNLFEKPIINLGRRLTTGSRRDSEVALVDNLVQPGSGQLTPSA